MAPRGLLHWAQVTLDGGDGEGSRRGAAPAGRALGGSWRAEEAVAGEQPRRLAAVRSELRLEKSPGGLRGCCLLRGAAQTQLQRLRTPPSEGWITSSGTPSLCLPLLRALSALLRSQQLPTRPWQEQPCLGSARLIGARGTVGSCARKPATGGHCLAAEDPSEPRSVTGESQLSLPGASASWAAGSRC